MDFLNSEASFQVLSVEPSSTKIISLVRLSLFKAFWVFTKTFLILPSSFLAGIKIDNFTL